ncbi:Myb/SANT-like DNA-binding domain [Popillia japonica]|uniref:Myb/SANT-like DNA-binding domain n=1 Tax=Popillia japonica TaxID=7064 RepID=A0AAW1IX97_POPJA
MAKYNFHITWEQCENKFKYLKKRTKRQLDNNRTTGRGRATWEFFDRMDQLFSTKPEITPIQVCSAGCLEDKIQDSPEPPEISNCGTSIPVSLSPDNIIRRKKRNRKEDSEPIWFKHFREDCEERHQERIEVQNKFLTIFQTLVDKNA